MEERFQKPKVICLLCRQAVTVDGLTAVHFERGEIKLTVNNVPARVCSSCGEGYVDEDVVVKLLQKAEAMSAAGDLEGVIEYNGESLS